MSAPLPFAVDESTLFTLCAAVLPVDAELFLAAFAV